jgi:hypothetical protein
MKKILTIASVCAVAGLSIFAVRLPSVKTESIGDLVPRFDKFRESPMTANAPKGWLLEFLKTAALGPYRAPGGVVVPV